MRHPREKIVHEAKLALMEALLQWSHTYGDQLTFAETIQVIQGELGSKLQSMAKYAIRYDRHGDTNKPGGLA